MSGLINKFSPELLSGKRPIFFSIVISGIVLPFILMIALAFTYGTLDNILYGSLKYFYLVFSLISFCILGLIIAGIFVHRSRSDKYSRLSFITFIISIVVILVVLFLSIFIVSAQLIRNGDTPPQLMLSKSNGNAGMPGISLVFRTANPSRNHVEYGLKGSDTGNFLSEEAPLKNHRFEFSGLEPGERYYYSLNGQEALEFKAPPLSGKLRFAAAGDSHFGNPWSRNDLTASMLESIKDQANDYSMFFLLGDCVDLGFIDGQWKQAFNKLSLCSSTVPMSYAAGNHDTLFGGVNLFRDYLCGYDESERTGCLWKRIDCGDVHFLILDVEWSTTLFSPSQEQWLREQLRSIPADDWCIVMSHTFYYCSGGYLQGWEWYDNRQTIEVICPIFEEYDVDIVMSAHKHQAELLQNNGVTYLVLGCFGGVPDPERTYISPASVWYQQEAYAFADITIDGDKADIIFRDSGYSNIYQTIIDR